MNPVYSNEEIPYSESSKSNKSRKGKTIYVLDASGNIKIRVEQVYLHI